MFISLSVVNLILHIGTEKTGTTSIQKFLKNNIDQLKRNGIYVPQTPMVGDGNHRWIPLFANNDGFYDEFVASQEFKNEEDRKEIIFYMRREFIDECQNAAKAFKTLILSSEHIQSRVRRPEEIQRLQNLLKEVACKTVIVIYIRDPIKTAISLLSTGIKYGATTRALVLPGEEYFEYFENICDHGQTINLWKECFPDAKIVVRRFDRRYLAKGDVVIDFCSQFIEDFCEDDYAFPKLANESLSLTGMVLLRKLNERFPLFVDNKINVMRGRIAEFVVNNTSDGSKFLPSRDEFELYKNHFSNSCESVRSHFFPFEKSLFFDQNEFAEENIDLAEVEIDSHILGDLIESLWIQKQKLELGSFNLK